MTQGVNVTPFSVVDGSELSPMFDAWTSVPAVLTSLALETVTGVLQLMLAALSNGDNRRSAVRVGGWEVSLKFADQNIPIVLIAERFRG